MGRSLELLVDGGDGFGTWVFRLSRAWLGIVGSGETVGGCS